MDSLRQKPRQSNQTPAGIPPRLDDASGVDRHRLECLDAFRRLDDLVLLLSDPMTWNQTTRAEVMAALEQVQAADAADDNDNAATLAIVSLYRLAYRTVPIVPKEYFFWLLCGRLHLEAHVGPEALVNRKDYLGPLLDHQQKIFRMHGWPEDDKDGNPWEPERHVDSLPKDYMAWRDELGRAADTMEKATLHAVCRKYGVEEIADLKENDPDEYERRCQIGHEYDLAHANRLPTQGITEVGME